MNVRLQTTMSFIAGVYYDNELRMNNYKITLNLLTGTENNHEQNIALDRVRYFVYNQLPHSVFINQIYQDKCQALLTADVKISNLPEEPVDQIIGIMLFSKLNAIMEDRMLLTEIEISSDLGDGIIYFHNDEESIGPFELSGWWNNNDSSYCDLRNITNNKVVELPGELSWKDLKLNWTNKDNTVIIDTENKVLFADFSKDETR